MSEQISGFYEFDSFCLDAMKRILLRMDEPVQLSPKVFDTLLVLIRNKGRVLDKDELMKAVWPDTVVEENNLTQNVSAIRKALGESRGENRYIVTVPGRGYSFVAEVRELQSHNGNGHHAPAPLKPVAEPVANTSDVIQSSTGQPREGRKVLAAQTSTRSLLSRRWRQIGITLLVGGLLIVTLAMVARLRVAGEVKQAVSGSTIKSIAVLPFKPFGAGAGDDYMGPGVADALITKLTNSGRVTVRPTSEVLRYQNASADPLRAGREMSVDCVLDGRIQRAGERVRVTVQLIRTSDGASLWAATFDEKFTDIFAVQDSISEQVMSALALKLDSREHERLREHGTENTEAYQAFLRAHYFMSKPTREGLYKAIEYFYQAIDRDPNYALAYVGLAACYLRLYDRGVPAAESYVKGRAAAEKALELDGSLAMAHAIAGSIAFRHDWDFRKAGHEFARARELDPKIAHEWFTYYLLLMNRTSEAETEYKRFRETHPLALNGMEMYHYFTRQYDRAEEGFRRAMEMDPDFHGTHTKLGFVYEQKGMYKEAIAEFQKTIALTKGDIGIGQLGHAYAIAGRKEEARQMLKQSIERSQRGHVWALYEIAVIHAGLGETEQALEYLEKAFVKHTFGPMWLRFDPRLDPLRSEPRFQEFVRRTGLPT